MTVYNYDEYVRNKKQKFGSKRKWFNNVSNERRGRY
jgi:hypothetical protein